MAENNMNALERVAGIQGRPIPGQSLTNNPDEPLPFEGPPKFVELAPALDHIFLQLTNSESTGDLKKILTSGFPVATMTEQLLMIGFSEGLWNPDLMMLLLEPVLYMIISVADRLGVQNIIIEPGDDPNTDEISDKEVIDKVNAVKKRVITAIKEKAAHSIGEPASPQVDVEKQMEETRQQDVSIPNKSLLSREEV